MGIIAVNVITDTMLSIKNKTTFSFVTLNGLNKESSTLKMNREQGPNLCDQ